MSLSLSERLKAQREEALSGLNRYFAGLEIHHSPSDEEAVRHYIKHGGAKGFAERLKQQESAEQKQAQG